MRNMIYRYVKDLTAGRLASGYSHCYRVYHLARELEVEYDDDILYAACFLHDIVVEEPDNCEQSAVKAENILHEVGFPPEKIGAVTECIKTHMPGGNPKLPEAKLLHDANLMDSLGAIGIVRLSIGAFFWYHKKNLKEVFDLIKEMRKKAESLIYPKSKELAKIKIEFMDQLIDEIDKEQML
jgi:uncharacterized protein